MATVTPPTPPTPPQPPFEFNHTAASIIEEAEKNVTKSNELWDHIVSSISPADATFNNTILPIALDENVRITSDKVLRFYSSSNPRADIREASSKAAAVLSAANIDSFMRDDVFQLVDAVFRREEPLDVESQKVLTTLHNSFANAGGVSITDMEKRARFGILVKKISGLCRQHITNLNNQAEGIWFAPEQLDGIPQNIIDGLQKGEGSNDGKLLLTFKRPHLAPAMRFATDANTRRMMYTGNENRAPENVAIIKEIVVLRDETARLLGYPNHATYKISAKMAQSPENVEGFLERLASQLKPHAHVQAQQLRELKIADLQAKGEEASDTKIRLWDQSFYSNKLKKDTGSIDPAEVFEYFPLDNTLHEIYKILEHLFGIRVFTTNYPVWHPDVKSFAVWNAEEEGGAFLGFLYLDLFPREAKHAHGGHYSLLPGFAKLDGTRHYPASVIMVNLSPPTSTKPSLLRIDEVRQLFTTMGHVMHNLLARTRFASTHGANADLDFIKIPAKTMENFLYTPRHLKQISHHYSHLSPDYMKTWRDGYPDDSDVPKMPVHLSDEAVEALIADRDDKDLQHNIGEIYRSKFDMRIHSPSNHDEIVNMDLAKVYHTIRYDLTGLSGPDDEDPYHFTNPQSVFRLIAGKFDAGYYTQIYSRLLSFDVFHFGFKNDTMNKQAGRRFRYKLLEKGGSQLEMQTIEEYLGRKPSTQAFCEELQVEGF